jgi:ABC-type transporter Mla subunit MlaD
MTDPAQPPKKASQPLDHGVTLVHDLRTTDLTPTERQALARSRRVAFGILAGCSLLAIPLAIYCWYLWTLTARQCIGLPSTTREELMLFNISTTSSWQSYLIALDLSSFSALTMALFSTRLAYLGTRNTLHYFQRDRSEFFGRAYHSVLFSEGFETLCVRFGLLGTLLSFTLVAVVFMSKSAEADANVGAVEAGSSASTTLSAQEVTGPALLATEESEAIPPSATPTAPTESNGTEIPTETQGDSASSTGKAETASAESEKEFTNFIFVLLCASLVSTLVGTGIAYAFTPSLNWINERAMGLHQLSQADARFAAEEFFRQVARTSERLGQFETTTVRLAEAAQHMRSFEENISASAQKLAGVISSFDSRVDHTSTRLAELVKGLERAVHVFDVSTLTGKQLAKKLDSLEAMSDRVGDLLSQLPERLNDPLKNMSLTAGKFREAAMSGEAAFKELRDMAGATHDVIGQTTQRTNTTWQMLREVQESLKALADNELTQTIEVAKVSQALESVGLALDRFMDRISGPYDGSPEESRVGRDGHDRDQPRLDGRSSHGSSDIRGSRPGGDLRDLRQASRRTADHEVRAHRSWWRRLFG